MYVFVRSEGVSTHLTAAVCCAFTEQRAMPRVWDIFESGLDALTTIGTSGIPSPSQSTDAPKGPTRNRIRNKSSLVIEARMTKRRQLREYLGSAMLCPYLFYQSKNVRAVITVTPHGPSCR
jgi:hypothetical protein